VASDDLPLNIGLYLGAALLALVYAGCAAAVAASVN